MLCGESPSSSPQVSYSRFCVALSHFEPRQSLIFSRHSLLLRGFVCGARKPTGSRLHPRATQLRLRYCLLLLESEVLFLRQEHEHLGDKCLVSQGGGFSREVVVLEKRGKEVVK